MSNIIHSEGGPGVLAKEWVELCEIMTQMAEGFAATDSGNGYLYRREAHDFCVLDPPADDAELDIREAEAATLRQRWSDRLRQGRRP